MNFQKHLNNLKIDKNYLIFAALLLVLVVAIPVIQSLLFSQAYVKEGKIEVNEIINVPFIKADTKDEIILFFGYVGCTEVCMPILNQLRIMYEKPDFIQFQSSTDIIFVNLLPEIKADKVKQFAQAFNSDFKGIYLSQHELNTIERKFRLFFSQDLFNELKINHTDYIYLLKRQASGQLLLKNIYTSHPFKPETLVKDLL